MDAIILLMEINDTFIPILSIPVAECNRFARNPLK